MTMPKKKPVNGDSDDAKKPPGRPRVLAPELDKRHQLRCATRDFDLWEAHSKQVGHPNVSSWLRMVANRALPSELRKRAR